MSIRDNLVLAAASDLSNHGVIDSAKERTAIDEAVEKLQIKVNDLDAPVRTLSGGNQQKVVIGKWLMKEPRILLLNDPTRGIDVGTKQEMYRLMRELAQAGIAILFYSTDYEELIGMCDRVVVCYGGKLIRELKGTDLNDHNLITAALNLSEEFVRSGSAGAASETGGGTSVEMADVSPILAVECRPVHRLPGVRDYVPAVFRQATKWPFGQRFDLVVEQGCCSCAGRDGPDASRFDGWF